MDTANALEQIGVAARPGARCAGARGVVAAAGDTQDATQRGNGIRHLALGNKLVFHGDCFAK